MDDSKICTTCQKVKKIQQFNKKKNGKFGREAICRDCRKEYWKTYRENNKEELNRKQREKDTSEYLKSWKAQNPEKVKSYNRNRDPEKVKKYQKRAYQKRRQDPTLRLRGSMSALMRHALKREGSSKAGKSFFEYVDYTLEELKQHLENQFDDKMNWENYGSYWHVDHIRPTSSFEFTAPTDLAFRECWSLQNLRPLEAIENCRKGARY